jgi:predicted phage tail protein
MLRKIKLYGALAKFVGHRVLEADVATAAEAVRFLVANWPELERHMNDQHYRVSVGTYDLDLEELHDPAGQQEIKIVPVMAGAGATGRIIAGIALIALSFGVATLAAGAYLAGTLSGFAAQAIGFATQAGLYIGAGLAISGVAQLLTPTPQVPQGSDSQDDPRKSYSFSGIQNVSRQGVPVPIVYGETIVGSVVISAGIDTVQVYN